MGNTMEVKLKEDKAVLEVTETLVGEFKRYISMADHSMAGLAKSLDAMRDACEMLLRQLDKATQLQVADETTGSDIEKVSSQQLARHLLEMIDASVSDHKFVVLESLSKLFSFVWNVGKSCIDDTENSPSVFLVDKYKTDHNAVEDGQSFTDCRVRSLQREVKNLQDKCSAFKEEVNNLNTREVHYRKEIKMLKDKTESQKTKIEDLKQRQTQQKKGEKECSVALNDDHENSSDSRSEDNDENQIINDLKEKNASLTQKLNSLENNAIAIKAMNEDQLKRKCEEIDNLKQEIEILKNKTQSISRSEADGESLTVDLEVLCSETYNKETNPKEETSTLKVDQVAPDTNKVLQSNLEECKSETDNIETKLKDEINTLKQELVALKTTKVLQCLEYDHNVFTQEQILSKRDLYQAITLELLSLNIDLKISKWRPSRYNSMPTDKIIIIPIFIYTTHSLKQTILRVLKDVSVGATIAIVAFYDAERIFVRKEMESNEPIGTEFEDLGGIFKFGNYSHGCQKGDMNEINFNAFLQFLKGKCLNGLYLSR